MNTDSIKFETMENNVVVYDHPELEMKTYTSLSLPVFFKTPTIGWKFEYWNGNIKKSFSKIFLKIFSK